MTITEYKTQSDQFSKDDAITDQKKKKRKRNKKINTQS